MGFLFFLYLLWKGLIQLGKTLCIQIVAITIALSYNSSIWVAKLSFVVSYQYERIFVLFCKYPESLSELNCLVSIQYPMYCLEVNIVWCDWLYVLMDWNFCGSSDVFSYPEDDSVEDPLLAQHLSHFGIDFSSLQKVSTLSICYYITVFISFVLQKMAILCLFMDIEIHCRRRWPRQRESLIKMWIMTGIGSRKMIRMPNHCLDQAILALSILAIGSCNFYISIYLFIYFWRGECSIMIFLADLQ